MNNHQKLNRIAFYWVLTAANLEVLRLLFAESNWTRFCWGITPALAAYALDKIRPGRPYPWIAPLAGVALAVAAQSDLAIPFTIAALSVGCMVLIWTWMWKPSPAQRSARPPVVGTPAERGLTWQIVGSAAADLVRSWGANEDQAERVYRELRDAAVQRHEAETYGIEDPGRGLDWVAANDQYAQPVRSWILTERLHGELQNPYAINAMARDLLFALLEDIRLQPAQSEAQQNAM